MRRLGKCDYLSLQPLRNQDDVMTFVLFFLSLFLRTINITAGLGAGILVFGYTL